MPCTTPAFRPLLALAALCGPACGTLDTPEVQVGTVPAPPSLTSDLGPGTHNLPSQRGHSTDGSFSGFSPNAPWNSEWSDIEPLIVPDAAGEPLARVYADHTRPAGASQPRLWLLIEWLGPLPETTDGCGILMRGAASDGQTAWSAWAALAPAGEAPPPGIVLLDGAPVTNAMAAASIGPSPEAGEDRLLVEVELPVNPGELRLDIRGPSAGGCATLTPAPALVQGKLRDEQYNSLDLTGAKGPLLASIEPARVVPGVLVHLAGRFGDSGELPEGLREVSATSTDIFAVVEELPDEGALEVRLGDEDLSALPLRRAASDELPGGGLNVRSAAALTVDGAVMGLGSATAEYGDLVAAAQGPAALWAAPADGELQLLLAVPGLDTCTGDLNSDEADGVVIALGGEAGAAEVAAGEVTALAAGSGKSAVSPDKDHPLVELRLPARSARWVLTCEGEAPLVFEVLHAPGAAAVFPAAD